MTQTFDLAVVGAGIVGLGHAVAAHRRGLRVVVVERASAISGATVRNFGHAGFSAHSGEAGEYAQVARAEWLRLSVEAGFWLRQAGTLVIARHEDERAVLDESGLGEPLTADAVARLAPISGAIGGALLHGDIQVDPREAGPAIARWLAREGVEFRWRTAALGAESGLLHTSRGEIRARAVVVAVNADVDQLFPQIAEAHGVIRNGLDMMLADGVGLGIPLLTGSSMLRYSAFASAPSLRDVRRRFEAEHPDLLAREVNQMYTERPDGTLIVGDTHYSGTTIMPFQDEAAFGLLTRLTENLFARPLRIRQRWQGVYATGPGDFLRAAPADGVRVVSVTSGIGMTTGLGLAASVIDELFGPQP
ncbi:FAD dependent oxidoreductase TIGR03364 [Homoserinimonas aerilata]|uniref:FAD dependent oxidoreductase TIGR03364 n=1 Tax=Homoserinimonas aerilata TaxID=1162970 RepID=A0A542YJ22_9MICO|nr:TIGR03364 family FAD-dependent oxidoreductase [Homoserinimonas aerilata]TQL48096.1 FAD dependent oxidoreductase TIGR03364 [Homoserinimonas aerilata]